MGCRPRDEVPSTTLRTGSFVSAKGPKTIGARAWPQGVPLPQSRLLGLRNSLRSDSPRPQIESSDLWRSHARRRRDMTRLRRRHVVVLSGGGPEGRQESTGSSR